MVEHRRYILGDEMGLGKTAQVLAALVATGRRAVVVCPAVVRTVWALEVAKWCPHLTIDVVEHGNHKHCKADITVVSYDLFGKVKLPRPGIVICDEAHYLQNHEARRTQAIASAVGYGSGRSLLPVWFLTGTPVWSRPRSAYFLLKVCGGYTGSYHDFAFKFCAARYESQPYKDKHGRVQYKQVLNDKGASNLDQLRDLLAPYLLRRLKVDVLKDLPAKTRQIVHTPRSDTRKDGAAVTELLMDFQGKDVTLAGGVLPPGPIATAIKEIGIAKIAFAVEYISNLLSTQNKVVVFAWNIAVLDGLQDRLRAFGVVRIDGSTEASDRAAAVVDFQTKTGQNGPRVFLGQTAAAGTGLTLTAACSVVFVQPEWTPANLLQAEDRVHRIGQKNPVNITYLITPGTIEALMFASVISKTKNANKILGE